MTSSCVNNSYSRIGKRPGQAGRLLLRYMNTYEPQQISVLWPGSRRLSVKVRRVIDFFVECFGEVPYRDRP